MSRPPLADHQRSGIDWIHRVGRGLLGDDPGLGKSRVAIEAFQNSDVLVVAPAMVIHSGTWEDELAKWADQPDRFEVVPYSRLNLRRTTDRGGSRPVNALRPDLNRRWDAVVVDEAHYTKGRTTSWTWAVNRLAKQADAVLEMTGTPMPNWAHELFTILQVLFPDDARRGQRFGSHQRWVTTWFDTSPNRFNHRAMDIHGLKACYPECLNRPADDPCEHFHRFARDNLGEAFLRRRRADVLDLPPLTEQVRRVRMDPTQAQHYREIKRDLLTVVDGEAVVAWNSGSKNVLLDRVTTSDWLLTKEGEPRGGKLEALRFELETRTQPVLVLAHYRDTVEASARVAESVGRSARFIHGGVSGEQIGQHIRAFRAGQVDVLVGSLETLAEGVTLTEADTVVFVEKSYKPSRNEQAMRRVHRMGQTRPVTVVDLVTPGTVDAAKRRLLAAKTDQQMRVLTAAEFLALT